MSMLHALFAVFPVKNLDMYKPTSRDTPSETSIRLQSEETGFMYNWCRQTGTACWCLPAELRMQSESDCLRPKRVLVVACDEGSAGPSSHTNVLMAFGSDCCRREEREAR